MVEPISQLYWSGNHNTSLAYPPFFTEKGPKKKPKEDLESENATQSICRTQHLTYVYSVKIFIYYNQTLLWGGLPGCVPYYSIIAHLASLIWYSIFFSSLHPIVLSLSFTSQGSPNLDRAF